MAKDLLYQFRDLPGRQLAKIDPVPIGDLEWLSFSTVQKHHYVMLHFSWKFAIWKWYHITYDFSRWCWKEVRMMFFQSCWNLILHWKRMCPVMISRYFSLWYVHNSQWPYQSSKIDKLKIKNLTKSPTLSPADIAGPPCYRRQYQMFASSEKNTCFKDVGWSKM